jgi:hypothetical protein
MLMMDLDVATARSALCSGLPAVHRHPRPPHVCVAVLRCRPPMATRRARRYRLTRSLGLQAKFLAAGPGADPLDPAFNEPMSIWLQFLPYFLVGVSEVRCSCGAVGGCCRAPAHSVQATRACRNRAHAHARRPHTHVRAGVHQHRHDGALLHDG